MSPTDSFVHLHTASSYSLRYGTATPAALVERAAELGMGALGLTDRDGLYGAVRFAQACAEHGIRPIVGADLACADPRTDARVTGRVTGRATGRAAGRVAGRTEGPGGAELDRAAADAARPPRVVVLARGRRAGWAALCRLVSAAHGDDMERRGRPVVDPELVARAGDGVFVLLGAESVVGRAAAAGRTAEAKTELQRWRAACGDAVVVEVVHHLAPPGHPTSRAAAQRLLRLAHEVGVPAVLTNAVRYPVPEDAPVADVLDAARRLVPLELRSRDRVNAEGYLKTGPEMAALAHDLCGTASEVRALLAQTRRIAELCALDPHVDIGLGSMHMPEAGVLGTTRAGAVRELRQRCEAGIPRRYGSPSGRTHERITERLESELTLIKGLGYEPYFLTVAEVVDLTRAAGIRCAARGSGAGSLVNHLLGISGVDPMAHGLLMERFLSAKRTSLPDIDLDVESARRTEVYDLILDRFGSDRTLCVAMLETYRVRHAVRDAGAALGLPPQEIDAVAKAFPHIRARDARAALRDLPELRHSRLEEGIFAVLFDIVEKLDGLPRHIALHPSGVLLSDRTLRDRTPVELSAQRYPMSQFDKDDVEAIGLLKLDVLGVRMQSAMAHAVTETVRVGGERIDLDAVPLDDPDTFELIRSTRTLGCFQIESPGQRELIGKFAPETFGDLIIDISLFRPGPVKSDMVTPFLNARHGWADPVFVHDDLRGILAETEGVVVFHEQVIRIIAQMTGCGFDRADQSRRLLGSIKGQQAIGDWFCVAADHRGYPRPVVERVWEILKAFASFGFCKAHAGAFALPTYQSAWLKAHHPAAFYAGLLTHDPGMYPKRLILDDARQFGVTVLPPSVNDSVASYTVERVTVERVTSEQTPGEGDALRIGLADVKGISDAELERIVREREGAPYASLADFRRRAEPSQPTLENLVLAGALDALHPGLTRRDLLLHAATDPKPKGPRRPGPSQLELADALAETAGDTTARPTALPAPTDSELIHGEIEALGLDHSAHLLSPYLRFLDELGTVRSRDLLTQRNRSEILIAGVKVATQTPPVRTGVRVVFATLDDATGPLDFAMFEDAQQHYASTVFHSWLLLVRGVIRRTGPRGVSLTATAAWELTALHELWREAGLDAVREVLAARPELEAAPPRRVMLHPSGFRMSPYADLKPPGVPAAEAPRKLWHTSPGSPG
ncbi:DNA polymerase III subunit alpha [Streptacidiphilus fuscans]|uniref:DNA-directed DNA polymerase n=1 Tax=Streptacidiphilus fuscans TaxID=2789292 RepID=A0A931FEW1_9ACTN|nr:DNA polymerase III subunit alpha [Streptacidiphilus fuscans]MBF9070998.1 DNA polymerase III subunit alpha [Streptacidiphilus fuscans]